MDKKITTNNNTNIINQNQLVNNLLQALVSKVENGHNVEFISKNNKTILKVDSIDSQSRTILTIEEQGTYNTSSMTNYKKVENISERRDLVKKLNKEGKSQREIASITMVSQKTICNDLKAIRKNKQ